MFSIDNRPTHWMKMTFPTTLFKSALRSAFLMGQRSIPNPSPFSDLFPAFLYTLYFLQPQLKWESFPLARVCKQRDGSRFHWTVTSSITTASPTSLNSQTSIYFTGLLCIFWKYHMWCDALSKWRNIRHPGEIFSKAPGFSCLLYFCVSLEICWRGMGMSICISAGGSRVLLTLQAIISTRATMSEIKLVVQRGATEATRTTHQGEPLCEQRRMNML